MAQGVQYEIFKKSLTALPRLVTFHPVVGHQSKAIGGEKMRRNVIAWCFPFIAGIVLIPARAKADSYSFSISGTGITASGKITVAPANGKNEVKNIKGTLNGFDINLLGVNIFDNNDNILSESSTPYLDSSGISFVANGINYNLSYQGMEPSGAYILNTHIQTHPGPHVDFYVGPDKPVATPEPPLILLLATGFAGLVFVFRRKLQLGG